MALQRRSRISAARRAHDRGVLAAVVATRRQELSLTQTELADLAGVGRGAIIALEAGRTASLDVLLALLRVLGLHLELARGTTTGAIEASGELAAHYDLGPGEKAPE